MEREMPIDEERARAAAAELVFGTWGWSPQQVTITAVRHQGTDIFTAGLTDPDGWAVPGAWLLVGSDATVWAMSSNPFLHDPRLTVELLVDAYSSGHIAYLDPEIFSDRVRRMTDEREDARRQFAKDLLAGSLRRKPTRTLP